MKTKVYFYEHDKHYELIKSWFDAREFPAPAKKFLPPTGFIVEFEEKPVCAGFLFRTDANAAVMGNFISDPGALSTVRHLCLDTLIKHLQGEAYAGGFELLACSTNIEKLGSRFEQMGFTKTDIGLNTYGRLLCQS